MSERIDPELMKEKTGGGVRSLARKEDCGMKNKTKSSTFQEARVLHEICSRGG